MSELKVLGIGVSIDGFAAGPNQDLKHPLGVGGEAVFEWLFGTATFQRIHGGSGGESAGADEAFAARSFKNIGAWIIGRNMFGPVRGPWTDESWKGWWGENPPFHVPVYVLTHHARAPIQMEGGTTFYFVTDGIDSALKQAKAAAKGKDVRLGGGASSIRQCLQAGLVDEVHLALTNGLLGEGENLLAGIDLIKLGFRCVESSASPKALHVLLRRS